MILAIISAIFCFAAAIIFFTPYFRHNSLLRPCAFYLIFEGVWTLASYAFLQLNPNNSFIFPINYIATIILMGYYIVVLIMHRNKSAAKKKELRQGRSQRSERSDGGGA